MIEKEKKYWNRWYFIVVAFLVVQIVVYYFISVYLNKG